MSKSLINNWIITSDVKKSCSKKKRQKKGRLHAIRRNSREREREREKRKSHLSHGEMERQFKPCDDGHMRSILQATDSSSLLCIWVKALSSGVVGLARVCSEK